MTTPGHTSRAATGFAGPYVLVPMAVEALPVNANGNGQTWPDLTPHFDYINNNGMVLGEQITPPQNFKTGPNPQSGIHIHWALPDGLTQGQRPQARATATVTGGAVTGITLTDPGSGYAAAPAVVLSGLGSGATATSVMSFQVTTVVVLSGGTGYTSAPTVRIAGGGGTGATGQAIVANGSVIAVVVTAPGSGYTSAPTVDLTGGGGTGATAGAQIGNGHVASVQVTAGGLGYSTPPTVNIAPSAVTQYPLVPNRWLVLRIYTNTTATPPKIVLAAWVVTSDLLTQNPASPPPLLPSWPAGPGQWLNVTRYLGGATPYITWRGDAGTEQLFLTAVGPGDPAFAAYYPNCRQVFGFYDSLVDLNPQLPAGGVNLTYLVVGWYSNPTADPLAGYGAAADWVRRMAQLRWAVNPPYPISGVSADRTTLTIAGCGDLSATFPAGTSFQVAGSTYNDGTYQAVGTQYIPPVDNQPSQFVITVAGLPAAVADGAVVPGGTVLPTQTLCHGVVYQVPWQGPNSSITPGIPTGTTDVAIGNTSVEALAALVASKLATLDPDDQNVARVLEAFQYHLLHDLDQPSGAVEVEEALHTNSFDRVTGGTWWEIRPVLPAATSPLPPLSPQVGRLLSNLNNQQQLVDGIVRNLTSTQRETYYAWYKRAFAEFQAQGGGPLLVAAANPLPDPNQLTDLTYALVGATCKLQQTQLIPALQLLTDCVNAITSLKLTGYELKATGMPRFWLPTDPAVLLAGEAVGRSFVHGEDGRFTSDGTLACRVSGTTITGLSVTPPGAGAVTVQSANLQTYYGSFPAGPPLPADVAALFGETLLLDPTQDTVLALAAFALAGVTNPPASAVSALAATIEAIQTAPFNAALYPALRARVERADRRLAAAAGLVGDVPSKVGFSPWQWPWTPLFFYWQAQWYPSYSPGDLATPNWGLWNNWQLAPTTTDPLTEVDFVWTGSASPTANPSAALTGVVLITPQAADNFAARLAQYVATLSPSDPNYQVLSDSVAALENLNLLSQSLSGLGSRLMMQWQTLQLPVISLGLDQFGDDDAVAAAVSAVIDNQTATAPILFDQEYFPVRAGHAQVTQLWLVDGFGQVKVISTPGQPVTPVLAESVQTPGDTTGRIVQLAPRITQPARLSLRLMAANDPTGTVQSNSAPSTSPVCGWLLPNHLDRSLMVYDAGGGALGELELLDGSFGSGQPGVRWAGVPGQPPALGAPLPESWNPHLRGFLQGIIDRGFQRDNALAQLFPVIDSTLATVDPLGARKDQSLSVLVGRPLALVRAALKLELDGLPVYDEGWTATQAVINTWESSKTLQFADHGFTKIGFPVRLGDIRNIRDGLIGYFVNDDYSTFFAAQPGTNASGPNPYIRYGNLVTLTADPSAGPVFVTLLIDPRGSVHATSGLLPVKEVEVNPDLIADALAAIDVTFITGPVISDADQLRLPLPAFQAGAWSWVDQPGVTVWQEDANIGKVTDKAVLADKPQKVYEGWLKLSGALGLPPPPPPP
jgi:hypothetical protein